MPQWNKVPGLKGATMSQEREDIQQDFQEDHRVEGHEANIRNFH
jgi:hypothetical protein